MAAQQDNNRMDRLEKNIELLFKGIYDLKESQKKTDEQLRKTDEQLRKTDEQLRKTDEQLKKTDEQLRETDEQLRETDERIKKTDEQMKKTDEQLRRTDAKLERIGRQLGDLGLVQGEVAEDLFYRNVKDVFSRRKMTFRLVRRNLKKKGAGEYDIVAVDADKVLVMEVKNKLEKRMVDRFLDDKLPRFKEFFPEFQECHVMGAVGALVVKDEVGRYAEKAGLYVLTQTEEGGAAILNRKGFKAKEFS